MKKLALALFLLWLPLVSGCGGSRDTPFVVIAIDGDLVLPTDADIIQIAVRRGSVTQFQQTYAAPLEAKFPSTLTLIAQPQDEHQNPAPGTLAPKSLTVGAPGEAVTVTVSGGKSSTVLLSRSATFTLPDAGGHKLLLRLDKACLMAGCASGTTCVGGACVSDAVNVASLPAATTGAP